MKLVSFSSPSRLRDMGPFCINPEQVIAVDDISERQDLIGNTYVWVVNRPRPYVTDDYYYDVSARLQGDMTRDEAKQKLATFEAMEAEATEAEQRAAANAVEGPPF